MPFIVEGLIIVFIVIVLALALTLISERLEQNAIFGGLETALFLVLMPKQSPQDEQQRDERVIISQMEQVLANFLQLKKSKLFGGDPSVTLEIASQTGGSDISFYVSVPKYMETVFEKYIQGVYPKSIIEKVPQDYTVFEPQAYTSGAYLKLKENFLLPISTYQKLDKDPLSTITNNLSKISPEEGAAVQLVLRPLMRLNLRNIGEKVLAKMREGKATKSAIIEATQSPIMGTVGELSKLGGPKEPANPLDQKKEQGFDQAAAEAIQNKTQKKAFEVNIRLVASAQTQERAEDIISHLTGAFAQFSVVSMNGFEAKKVRKSELKRFVYEFSFRMFNNKQSAILNTEEVASLYHFPTHLTETPYIKSVKSVAAAPPIDLPDKGLNLLGRVVFRGEEKKVYFATREDRRRHMYLIGQTGTGKSSLLREMIRQDIQNGEGVAVIDPHGELVEHTLANIPKNRVDDVVIFEPFDLERPSGLNMLEYDTPEQKDFAVQEMIAIFYKLFPPEIIGPMFEHYMRNAMLALMANQEKPGTLVEIPKMFTDPTFLQERLKSVSDPVVKSFWTKEWAQTTGNTRSDMLGYVVSKVGRFIENEMMRNIIGQGRSGFDLAKIMDEGKIFLANLSKGLTGEVNSSLLGLILVSKMQMAAMKRARTQEADRKDFYLYIDEFQNFTTDSIATILSEARKYKLNLIMAHQYIPQLTDQIKNAVLGNVGTMGAFRIGSEDAEFLEKQFEPNFSRFDLVNLDNFNLIIKMMLKNKTSTPFKMEIYPPNDGRKDIVEALKKISKLRYGKPKAVVEKDIFQRSFVSAPPPPLPTANPAISPVSSAPPSASAPRPAVPSAPAAPAPKAPRSRKPTGPKKEA